MTKSSSISFPAAYTPINPYSSSIGNSSSWNPNSALTSTLTEDQADALYFECRDTDYSHEQAVAYVRKNGGSSDWEPPEAADYQGLPDVPQPSNSNAGRGTFDRMVASQQSAHAESSTAGASGAATGNERQKKSTTTTLRRGKLSIQRTEYFPDTSHPNGRIIFTAAAGGNKNKRQQRFTVPADAVDEQETINLAFNKRQDMMNGTWEKSSNERASKLKSSNSKTNPRPG